jgi:Fic family protein
LASQALVSWATQAIQECLDQRPFRLRSSLILALHREAVRGKCLPKRYALSGISNLAGNFRPDAITFGNGNREGPGAHLVPELVQEMCDYVNNRWERDSAVHLASYVLWRLCWIHPFADGNGRTSRVLSFVVLSVKIGAVLPGTPKFLELIVEHRKAYQEALNAADDALEDGLADVSKMEKLVDALLTKARTKQPSTLDLIALKTCSGW